MSYNIFSSIEKEDDELKAKEHQEYLKSRGITEEEYKKELEQKEQEKKNEEDKRRKKRQERLAKFGLTEEQFGNIQACLGCLTVIIIIILFFYFTIWISEVLEPVIVFLGSIYMFGFIAITFILLIGGCWAMLYESSGSKITSTLLTIIIVVLFIFIMSLIPENCKGDPDHYDYDRSLTFNKCSDIHDFMICCKGTFKN